MTRAALKVLVVDDNRTAADALARVLRKKGDDVRAAYGGAEAIELLKADPPDLVLTDLKMEPVDGLAVLEAARAQRPPIEVIVFTAYGAVEVAVRAMRLGARDFLTKPVTVDQVQSRLAQLRKGLGDDEHGEDAPELDIPFIAESAAAIELLTTLRKLADVPSPVWLEGEIGSGRGHAARALHEMGSHGGPFNVRDLGRDAPWPASGTVLLPNVDDLADDLQRDLFRSLSHVPDGVRLVATAGPGGRRMVAEGRLRSELYYALAVVVVPVPPLRDREADIAPMADLALDRYAERYNRSRPALGEAERRSLRRHSWPGNVRELLNLAERAVVMGADAITLEVVESAAPGLPTLEPGFSLAAYLESVERRLLVEALRKAGGDRAQAGKLLGVERNTLRYKLNKYGLLEK